MADSNKQKHIQIYGHRGARGLAPENTIAGYKTAIEIGVDYIDMDVNMSKDGVIVVTHDFTLNPDITRDADGNWIDYAHPTLIKDLTFAELQKYDVGRIKPNTQYGRTFSHQNPVDKERVKRYVNAVKTVRRG